MTDSLTVDSLKFTDSFNQLSYEEKCYAYYFYKASWAGFPIVLFNMSKEGPILFVVLQKFFKSFKSVNEAKALIEKNFSPEAAKDFIEYAAQFYDNAGNYRSFGFDKIYSKVDSETFEAILKLSNNEEVISLFKEIKASVFDTSDQTKSIGLTDKGGVNNYYLGDITEEEITKVDAFLQSQGIATLNTRLIKFKSNEDKVCYGYLVGSVENKIVNHKNEIFGFYGDFSEFLTSLNSYLAICKTFTKRPYQLSMIDYYIESFNTGSVEAHKKSQIEWVKDIKPVVETNIGWIETYIDPMGSRGYYEGMVALVDKENTKKFTTLVQNASDLLSPQNIPWTEEIENYPFKEPDYTQIDVVCFASDGCPMGINIPNYDDIREVYGFKNVTIGNNQPKLKKDKIKFMNEEDKDIVVAHGAVGVTIHTACHELLGHGSGKLLRKLPDGKFNFNYGQMKDPFTNKTLESYYDINDTFESKFTDICRSYEECRADLNGLFFGKMEKVAKIFGVEKENLNDVIFSKWHIHFRKGILGLKFFNDINNKWGQAHTQGAYVFTSFILNNQKKEKPILEIQINKEENDFVIVVNKENLIEYGHDLVTEMLIKLNVWKATANDKAAREFYYEHSKVNEFMMKIRKIVIEKAPPRGLKINHNIEFNESQKEFYVKEYEDSCEGLITSYIERFDNAVEESIIRQNRKWDDLKGKITN